MQTFTQIFANIVNIITAIILIFSLSLIFQQLFPKFKKLEIEDESSAKTQKIVKLNKQLSIFFVVSLLIIDIFGILIFPKIITEFLGFNYLAFLIFWCVILIFDNTVAYFLFSKAVYNENEIYLKRPFMKIKCYKIDDITSFTKTGKLKITTKHGNFTLFKAMSGTESLREFLSSKLDS